MEEPHVTRIPTLIHRCKTDAQRYAWYMRAHSLHLARGEHGLAGECLNRASMIRMRMDAKAREHAKHDPFAKLPVRGES